MKVAVEVSQQSKIGTLFYGWAILLLAYPNDAISHQDTFSALFSTVHIKTQRKWNHCSSKEEWIMTMGVCIHNGIHILSCKYAIMKSEDKWTELENSILSGVSQVQKEKHYMSLSYMEPSFPNMNTYVRSSTYRTWEN